MAKLTHLPYLDSVRGLALLLVILFHYGTLSFGWMGVELFFVLSGFLISSILLSTKDRPLSKYLGRFYIRRVLRIFPVYFCYILIMALAYYFSGQPREFSSAAIGLVTFTYNLSWLRHEVRPTDFFIHFWSLSVEEQFYLVWPLLVFFASTKFLRRLMILAVAVAPLGRWYFGELLNAGDHSSAVAGRILYFFTLTHIDALAAGTLLATFNLSAVSSKVAVRIFAVLALATLAAHYLACATYGTPWQEALTFGLPELMHTKGQHIFGLSLTILASSWFIFAAIQKDGSRMAGLSVALAKLGKVSFCGYVLHLPVILFFSTFLPVPVGSWQRGPLFFIVLVVIYVIASASYRYFEGPILKIKERFE